jgi:hypothetical protein
MKVARPIADFVQAVELMRTQHYIYAYAFFPFFFPTYGARTEMPDDLQIGWQKFWAQPRIVQ